MPRALITVPFSQYCEKARWALDYAGVDYVEYPHLPVLHWAATLRHRRSRLPVLVADEGVLGDSTAIVRYADGYAPKGLELFPNDAKACMECDVLAHWFDVALGPAVRRIACYFVFSNRDLLFEIARRGVPRREYEILRRVYPLARIAMTRLAIDQPGFSRSYQQVWNIFGRMAARLGEGRRYLVGDAFSAADLTFAALGAPMVAPLGYGFAVPWEQFPSDAHAMWKEMRQHPAGAFIVRIYEEHRRQRCSRTASK